MKSSGPILLSPLKVFILLCSKVTVIHVCLCRCTLPCYSQHSALFPKIKMTKNVFFTAWSMLLEQALIGIHTKIQPVNDWTRGHNQNIRNTEVQWSNVQPHPPKNIYNIFFRKFYLYKKLTTCGLKAFRTEKTECPFFKLIFCCENIPI